MWKMSLGVKERQKVSFGVINGVHPFGILNIYMYIYICIFILVFNCGVLILWKT